MQNLKIFGKIIVYLRKQLHKIEHWKENASAKWVHVYEAKLNKNLVFLKINCEKSESYQFLANQTCIYTTNHAKKAQVCRFSSKQRYIYTTNLEKSLKFCRYNHTCTQQIAKKSILAISHDGSFFLILFFLIFSSLSRKLSRDPEPKLFLK